MTKTKANPTTAKTSEQLTSVAPSIEHMSYGDLLKHQDAIANRIAELREVQFENVVSHLAATIEGATHVAKPEEFLTALRRKLKGEPVAKKRKPYKMRIYRHPDDASLQWTRRNRYMPQWIQDFIDKGVDIEQFRIDSDN